MSAPSDTNLVDAPTIENTDAAADELRQLRETVWRLQCENSRLKAAIEEVEQLCEESDGVYGLGNRNDHAEWQWITENRLTVLSSLME